MAKIREAMGGDAIEVQSGGVIIVQSGGTIDLKSGAKLLANGSQGAALTAQLTTITPADAEGTPDYAIAGVTNSSAYGFASAQEAITVLYVIKNLQTRLAEVEARLEAMGAVVAN
jgi:hypothetical protein